MRRLLAEFELGARLAFAGGRRGWIRTALVAAGVAIGAAMLLLAASVPVMLESQRARTDARNDQPGSVEVLAGDTLAVAAVEAQLGRDSIRGRLIWPETPQAPLPPGVPAFPADRQMYASPALQQALAGPNGDLLRRQVPYAVVGTIAPEGLAGPKEIAYYAGYQAAENLIGSGAWRIDRFGYPSLQQPSGPGEYVVLVVVVATLLLPISLFISAALRFGADIRERRLAAIRLVGADRRAVLRIALGESLVPAGLGLLTGVALYLGLRSRAADLPLFDESVYPSDVHTGPAAAAAVVAAMLALSAGATLLGFRGVAVEPLGVFRRSRVWHGRLWWRLVPSAASLVLLYPVALDTRSAEENRTGVGVVMLIVGLVPLLPYLVPLVVRALPGGPVSWQLAAQQLRRNPVAATRAITGIAVLVTGAVALNLFFAAATVRRATPDDPHDPSYILQVRDRQSPQAMRERTARFEQISGVRAGTVAKFSLFAGSAGGELFVGDCAALRQVAVLDQCTDGDVFSSAAGRRPIVLLDSDANGDPVPGPAVPMPPRVRPATRVGSEAQAIALTVLMTPTATPAVLATAKPDFVETRMFASMDAPDTVAGQLRGIAAEIDPLAMFTALVPEHDKYRSSGIAADLASTVGLVMMGVGILLDVAARLHERRRLLGVLAAVGARRSTVAWSVLLQVIVPLLAGLTLAIGVGAALGAVLMRMSRLPVLIAPSAIVGPVATGLALVLAVTVAVLLPAIHRVTRTEELRYE